MEFQRKNFVEKPRGGGENEENHPNNLYIRAIWSVQPNHAAGQPYIQGCRHDPQDVHGETLDLIGGRGKKRRRNHRTTTNYPISCNKSLRTQARASQLPYRRKGEPSERGERIRRHSKQPTNHIPKVHLPKARRAKHQNRANKGRKHEKQEGGKQSSNTKGSSKNT